MEKSYQSNIWKGYIFSFVIHLHFLSGVLIPFFMDWGKISFFQIMILQSWFVFWVFILEIPTGAVADFFSRKTSLLLATIVNILAVIVYTSKPEFLIFLLGEFLWALAVALMSGADEAFIYDSLKEIGQEKQSKKVLGRFNSFYMVGLMVASPIGSIIAVSLGLRWTVLLMAVPFAIAFFVVLTFKEPKIKKRSESLRYIQTLVSGVKYFYSHKILRPLALDGIVIAVLTFLLIWTYQLVLKEFNVNLVYFGVVASLICGSQIVVMNNFGRFEKLFRSKSRYLFFSAFISGIAFIFLGVNTYVIPAIVAMMIISGFGMSRFVLISNYMQKHIESHDRATVISTASMIQSFGLGITYPFIGLMAEWSISYSLIIIGVVIVGFSFIHKIKESYLVD